MADNTIANAIKFLKGEEGSLPATKTEGQVYFAYKNVGTAEKPSYTGAIYIDTPIGGTQTRVKMTANADIADKAFNDSAGKDIRGTYLSSLGYTDDGKQTILIKGSGNNQTKIALPIASATKSGIVTTDAQSFGGTKTFVTINSNSLTVTGSGSFNYSGIGSGTADAVRPVWFSDNSANGKPVVNTNFTYNPATQTLKVANLSGTAEKATSDGNGQNIRNTYIKDITINNSTMTITKGSGATSTLSVRDKLYSGNVITTKDDLDKFIETNVFKFGHINAIEGYNGLEKNDGIVLSASWKNNTNYGHQIFIDDSSYNLRHRYKNSTWSDWASILDSTNYNSYAPTKTGGGASGTWGISISGNAATASKATNDDGGQNIRSTYVKYKTIKFSAVADKVYLLESNGVGSSTNTTAGDSNISTAIIPAATDKAAGVITTGTQTFSGEKKFNNTIFVNDCLAGNPMTGTSITKLVLLSIPNANIGDTSYTSSVYFKALLKWICSNYPSKANHTFIGRVSPNSQAYASIYIYDTSKIDATSGLPEYSSGSYVQISGNIYTFGTYNYAFYFREALMNDSKYAGSASSGGAATSANKLNTNAGSLTQPIYFKDGVPVSTTYTLNAHVQSVGGDLSTGGWKKMNGNVRGSYITVAYNNKPAAWNSQPYSASIVFGVQDIKGLLDCGYNTPIVTFGGASNGNSNDNNPKWYFKLSGTSEQTYTFPTTSKTLAANDGSNATGTNWGISITGSAAKLTTARTLWGQSFDGSANVSGQISGCTRIMNTNGDSDNNLYLGNSNNKGWVVTQDIRSDQGTDKWIIKNSGIAGFKNVNIGYEYTKVDSSYALKVQGNSFYNGKVYFANNTTYYINESADANLRAVGTGDNTYIAFPQGGGYRTTTSTATGYLKITLPKTWSNTMMSFKVTIYEFQNNLSCTYYLSGYNYNNGGGKWVNVSAYSLSKSDSRTISNRAVRFGHDGSKCAIYIGESNSSWNYPQVQISDITVGYSTYDYVHWASGWSVGFTTTLGTITSTITTPCISNSAATLQTNAGSATKPVYFSGGIPVQCNDTLANNISGKSASTDAINWVAGNEIRFTKPNYTEAKELHIGWAWSDNSKVKLISAYRFDGGDGQLTQVTASQFNGTLNGNANTATALTSSAGTSTQPIYFSGGKPVACTYTLSKSVPADAKFTDTNTWRPLGTTADTACAGNDSRLSNARPASDVSAWAKASTKPTYSWGEITGKPSTFTPSDHTHNKIMRADHLDTVDKLDAFKEANAFKYATVAPLDGLNGLAKNDGIILSMTWKDSTSYGQQIFIDDSGPTIAHRYNSGNTWSEWIPVIDSKNYTSYTVTKTGSGASGTWGISVSGSSASCTGNAATATKLQTARTISLTGSVTGSGTFDGSGNLSITTTTNHSHGQYLPLAGGKMTGNITYDAKGTCYIGAGANDAVNMVGGALNNLVISSWNGISFSTVCSSTFVNKSAVSIDCRNGILAAASLRVGNGSGSTINFCTNGGTAVPGAKIVAYNDRIEFVFA